MLYYTGVTRVAKNILQEIVRGMFLNSRTHCSILRDMLVHAKETFNGLNKGDLSGFSQHIQKSWEMNQRLDAGTNPEAVQAILNPVKDYLAACKLLGAGGGGYLFMVAKDPDAALRIRQTLTDAPPNEGARFIDFSISQEGLRVTRS